MAGKIFINYRRDDEKAQAARLRDRLSSAFGANSVFMDVDNLLAGQRFDRELEKALALTDVFLAVIGPRWMELLAKRQASSERDYVREEIAEALTRNIMVIPVLIEHAQLPNGSLLPDDIRELVLHQKHNISHERFGRDVEDLIAAITVGRKARKKERSGSNAPLKLAVAASIAALGIGGAVLGYQSGILRSQIETEQTGKLAGLTEKAEDVKRKVHAAAWQTWSKVKDSSSIAALELFIKQFAETDYAALARQRIDELKKQQVAIATPPSARCDGVEAVVGNERRCLKPKDNFKDCDTCPEMVVIPSGEFTMGSPPNEAERNSNEGTQRKVTIGKPFAAGRFEVKFAEWDTCVTAGGCKHKPSDEGWGKGTRPVISVSWDDAKEYVSWLGKKTGRPYRLLSEAEWEYAARAGTTTAFSTGRTITTDQANFDGNFTYGGSRKGVYRAKTIEVGSFKPNSFGLHDVHGNVWEWVEDCYQDNYNGSVRSSC